MVRWTKQMKSKLEQLSPSEVLSTNHNAKKKTFSFVKSQFLTGEGPLPLHRHLPARSHAGMR